MCEDVDWIHLAHDRTVAGPCGHVLVTIMVFFFLIAGRPFAIRKFCPMDMNTSKAAPLFEDNAHATIESLLLTRNFRMKYFKSTQNRLNEMELNGKAYSRCAVSIFGANINR